MLKALTSALFLRRSVAIDGIDGDANDDLGASPADSASQRIEFQPPKDYTVDGAGDFKNATARDPAALDPIDERPQQRVKPIKPTWKEFSPTIQPWPSVEAGPTYPPDGDGGANPHLAPTAFIASAPHDSVVDYAELGKLSVRAASVRGRSHRLENTHRQDHFCLRSLTAASGDEVLGLAVCDGLGQGKLSHIAARLAATMATDELALAAKASPFYIDWVVLLEAVNRKLAVEATALLADRGIDIVGDANIQEHMATTLVVAMVVVGEVDATVSGVSVGDSSAWRLTKHGLHPQTPVKNSGAGPASSTVGAALPAELSRRSLSPFEFSLAANDALLVVSDGIGDPIGDGTTPIARTICAEWADPPSPYRFAEMVNFSARAFDDDRTALGIWFESGEVG